MSIAPITLEAYPWRSRGHESDEYMHYTRKMTVLAFIAGTIAAIVATFAVVRRPSTASVVSTSTDTPSITGATLMATPIDRDRVRFALHLELTQHLPDELNLRFPGAHLEDVKTMGYGPDRSTIELHGPESIVLRLRSAPPSLPASSAYFSFVDRPASRAFGWGYEVGNFEWINDFGVARVWDAWLETDVAVVDGLPVQRTGGKDYRCGAEPHRSCREFGYDGRRLPITMGRVDDRLGYAALAVSIIGAAVAFVRVTRAARARLVRSRGVMVPPSIAMTEQGAMYRDAPPPASPPIVLPAALSRAFSRRVAFTAFAVVASIAAVAYFASGVSPIRMPLLLAGWIALAALVACASLASERVRALCPLAIVPLLFALVLMNDKWFGLGALPLVLAGAVSLLRAATGRDALLRG